MLGASRSTQEALARELSQNVERHVRSRVKLAQELRQEKGNPGVCCAQCRYIQSIRENSERDERPLFWYCTHTLPQEAAGNSLYKIDIPEADHCPKYEPAEVLDIEAMPLEQFFVSFDTGLRLAQNEAVEDDERRRFIPRLWTDEKAITALTPQQAVKIYVEETMQKSLNDHCVQCRRVRVRWHGTRRLFERVYLMILPEGHIMSIRQGDE